METPMWGSAVTRQQLLQSISLFQTLDAVPEPPKDHVLMSERDSRYSLSLLREKEITSNLAFLSSTSNNSLRVTAVCIEEHHNKEGITIRIASNTGDLSVIVRGFEKIAQVLEQAALRENPKFEDQKSLLKQIVELDFYRILSRLRSRHARKSIKTEGKSPLIIQLSKAVKAKSKSKTKLTESARERIRSLQALFTQLENLPDLHGAMSEAQELLSEIVKEAREFTLAIDLKAVLENSTIDPSLKTYLPEAVKKIGRYYAAASDLVSAAREKTGRIFLKVNVETVQIRVPPFIKEMKEGVHLSNLPGATTYSSKYRTKKLTSNLRKRMVEITMSRKVHAEIQLLFYYELNPDSSRPRFICSSKKACYLCDLFLHVHGSFKVPRTHGKLYDTWILPDWLEIPIQRHKDLAVITQRFKDRLDDKINETLISGPKQNSPPDESCAPSEAHYSSTEHSALLELRSHDSGSTLPPRSCISEEGISRVEERQVPPYKPSTTDLNPDNKLAPNAAELASNQAVGVPTLDLLSRVTVRRKDLPYSQIITLATPSLCVRIDKLFVTLEFAEALSGRLFITKKGEWEPGKTVRVVEISEIPTTSELEVHCHQGSNEVQLLLKSQGTEIFYISFLWDGAH